MNKGNEFQLTNAHDYKYNEPIKCFCGKVLAYKEEDKIILYCKQCKRTIAIVRA